MIANIPKLAFVDVETTGSSPSRARITEIGVVIVQWPADGLGPPAITTWRSLVSSDTPVPEEIRFLTGISNGMLAGEPDFAELAPTLNTLLSDAVFVAHHARFDYGFIKAEMARAGIAFTAKTLCTVRLSRLLNPDRSPHTLDAIIIRHELPCPDRHRALGDADVLWTFLQRMLIEHGQSAIDDACRKLLQKPNLPAHLGLKDVEQIPASAGIYFFHGLNSHPLYIGKSRNIRQRIAQHFCGDHQSERGIRLASETRRISWRQTAGEFSALLAEIQAIDQFMPAHNRALRRRHQAFGIGVSATSPKIQWIDLTKPLPESTQQIFGPFASRASARSKLKHLAAEHHWCLKSMGLEKRSADPGPCFARQVNRCTGACTGDIALDTLAQDIIEELAPMALPAWPEHHRLLVVEQGNDLIAWHWFDQWRWLESDCTEQANSGAGKWQPATDWLPASAPGMTADDQSAGVMDHHIVALLRQHFDPLPDLQLTDWTKTKRKSTRQRTRLFSRWLSHQPATDNRVGDKNYEAALN